MRGGRPIPGEQHKDDKYTRQNTEHDSDCDTPAVAGGLWVDVVGISR